MDNLSKKNKDLERLCHDQKAEIERLRQALTHRNRGQIPLSPTLSLAAPPSLDSASPSDTSITDFDQVFTPTDIKVEQDHGVGMKFDDSQSAALCAQQWTSNNFSEPMILQQAIS